MLSRKPDVLSDASVSSKSKIRAMTSEMELGDKDEWKRNGGRERTQTDGAKKRTAAILPECGGGCARCCLWVLLAGVACRCCLPVLLAGGACWRRLLEALALRP